jgi:RHS repeat-associated protein
VSTAEGFYSFAENRYIYNYQDQLGNTRITFAKNNAGVLESIDTNNYYPFGLNHIGGSSYSNFGGYYNYKFGGKELQETGWSDFGARMYMSDLGRWGVVDPRSQYTHEAYSYVWNNPVRFNDPTGMEGEEGKCPPNCPSGVSAINILPSGQIETTIHEITLTGKAADKSFGPGSLAMSAFIVSQADSPVPGPGDVIGGLMLIGAGVWWTYDYFATPSTGYTTIADPGAGYGSMKTEDTADEDKDVNGVDVPEEGKRRKNRLPDKGEPNTTETNDPGTTSKKYGPDEIGRAHV